MGLVFVHLRKEKETFLCKKNCVVGERENCRSLKAAEHRFFSEEKNNLINLPDIGRSTKKTL